MRKLLFSLLFVAVAATCLPAIAQSNAKAAGVDQEVLSQIPQRMKSFVDQQTVAGAVTLVAHGSDIVEFDATGMADIEAGHPMRKDTIFQIMSMTKPVTAIGIMMLAEQGKLALRDPVEQYLPEFHGLRVATTAGPDADTPEHPQPRASPSATCLPTPRVFRTIPGRPPSPTTPQTMSVPLDEVVRQLAKQPLLFQPGTQWSYSSPGIEILGRIIEVCSGEKYEDFITEHILRPLGMKDSFFFPPPDKIARIAMVYAHKDGKLVRAPASILGGDPAKYRQGAVFPAPGWGLYSTAEDLLHLYRMMLNDGVVRGPPLSVAVFCAPNDRAADHWNPAGGMDARLGLWPGLGGGDRSVGRACGPHDRYLRPRRRVRDPGLDRSQQ